MSINSTSKTKKSTIPFNNKMRAVVCTKYGAPDVLKIKEIERPIPKTNEVLIKIYAANVTSTDVVFRKGRPFIARFFTGMLRPKNMILGSELAGKIEDVGKDVKRFKKGDQVFGATTNAFNAYAEYISQPEEGPLTIKPPHVTYQEAIGFSDALTALPFLRNSGNIQSGQKVLIYGASGAIGTAAVQLAAYFGAEVTGVCSTANLELVKSLGAEKVIDYTKEDFTKTKHTYDIFFDTVGKSSFLKCKNILKKNGIYLSTVLTFSTILQMLWTSIYGRKKIIFAATGLRSSHEKIQDLNFLKNLISTKKIKPVIDKIYPLEKIAEAHRYVEKGHKRGNVVITLKEN